MELVVVVEHRRRTRRPQARAPRSSPRRPRELVGPQRDSDPGSRAGTPAQVLVELGDGEPSSTITSSQCSYVWASTDATASSQDVERRLVRRHQDRDERPVDEPFGFPHAGGRGRPAAAFATIASRGSPAEARPRPARARGRREAGRPAPAGARRGSGPAGGTFGTRGATRLRPPPCAHCVQRLSEAAERGRARRSGSEDASCEPVAKRPRSGARGSRRPTRALRCLGEHAPPPRAPRGAPRVAWRHRVRAARSGGRARRPRPRRPLEPRGTRRGGPEGRPGRRARSTRARGARRSSRPRSGTPASGMLLGRLGSSPGPGAVEERRDSGHQSPAGTKSTSRASDRWPPTTTRAKRRSSSASARRDRARARGTGSARPPERGRAVGRRENSIPSGRRMRATSATNAGWSARCSIVSKLTTTSAKPSSTGIDVASAARKTSFVEPYVFDACSTASAEESTPTTSSAACASRAAP